MRELSTKQLSAIDKNLRAFTANFGFIKIKYMTGQGYYVYTKPQDVGTNYYTQLCPNVDYLNGWLYGCVQAVNHIVTPSF